jgi:hypothetical protein
VIGPANVQPTNSAQVACHFSRCESAKVQPSNRVWPGSAFERSASSKRQSLKMLWTGLENRGCHLRSKTRPRKSQLMKVQASGVKRENADLRKSTSAIVARRMWTTPLEVSTLSAMSVSLPAPTDPA